jgi:hypothetical protein
MPASSRASVAGARQPLVELAALQSVVCGGVAGCRVTSSLRASPFPTDRRGVPPTPFPGILRCRVHPLVRFVLLQSSFSQSSALALSRSSSSPGVCFPLHDISTWSPPFAGRPEPVDVPSSAFRTLATACSSSYLAHLFRCAAVCRVLASRGCFLPPGRTTSSVAVTLAPLAPLACRLPGASDRRVDLRVVLQTGVRDVRWACSAHRHPSPFLRFHLPRAFLQ